MVMREAEARDIPGIAELWDEFMAFHEALDPLWVRRPGARVTWLDFIARLISDPDFLVLVTENESRLVGYMVATMQDCPPIFTVERYGFVQEIAVTASCRGQGLARKMYRVAEEWLQSQGANHIRANIDATNELSQEFWKSMGFGPYTLTYQKKLDHEN
jgi:ribosomal protein S18 acetylase RimI-like enzyme|nr:GNAT family N-acetyltransferase [Candidatus Krumholzibacteria bacterium]